MKKKYIFLSCVVVFASVVSVLCFHFYQQRATPEPEGFPYFLSTNEIESLKRKSEHGDCVASFRLAKYYLYGALELDTGTKWLRVAAKSCTDPTIKEYLAYILIHNKADPATTAEINQLVAEIRKIDPAKATKLEDRLKEMAQSPPSP